MSSHRGLKTILAYKVCLNTRGRVILQQPTTTMSYQQKLQQSKDKAAEHLLGTKIRDLMTNLRNGKAKNAARRWIWELIQNAKDVAFETNPVKIEVSLESEDNARSFQFRHNGKPFSIDDITFLIEQVSTKDQEITETEKTKKKKK